MNAGWNLTSFPVPFFQDTFLWRHPPFVYVWLKCYIHIVAKVLVENNWQTGQHIFLFTVSICGHITLLGLLAHSEQQLANVADAFRIPICRYLLMLWQLVNLFILQEGMEVDRASWSSCLQTLPLSTWLSALSRRLNSPWWAIICGVKVQQVHWPFCWPLPLCCL